MQQLIVVFSLYSTLQNVTGYQIVVEDRREHVLDDGEVNPNKLVINTLLYINGLGTK